MEKELNIRFLERLAERAAQAQAEINEIIQLVPLPGAAQKLAAIKAEMRLFHEGEQGQLQTLDAINSIINDDE